MLTFHYDVLSKLQGKVCTLTQLHELCRIVATITVIYGKHDGCGWMYYVLHGGGVGSVGRLQRKPALATRSATTAAPSVFGYTFSDRVWLAVGAWSNKNCAEAHLGSFVFGIMGNFFSAQLKYLHVRVCCSCFTFTCCQIKLSISFLRRPYWWRSAGTHPLVRNISCGPLRGYYQ